MFVDHRRSAGQQANGIWSPSALALVRAAGRRSTGASGRAQRRRRAAGAHGERRGRPGDQSGTCCGTDDGAWASGSGAVEKPLPPTSGRHAARCSSWLADAVERAKQAHGARSRSSAPIPSRPPTPRRYLRLLVDLRDRRSEQGWEVADLLAQGMTQKRIAGCARHHPDGGEPARQGGRPAAGGSRDSGSRAHAGAARPASSDAGRVTD